VLTGTKVFRYDPFAPVPLAYRTLRDSHASPFFLEALSFKNRFPEPPHILHTPFGPALWYHVEVSSPVPLHLGHQKTNLQIHLNIRLLPSFRRTG
jgi:hypothetical protein